MLKRWRRYIILLHNKTFYILISPNENQSIIMNFNTLFSRKSILFGALLMSSFTCIQSGFSQNYPNTNIKNSEYHNETFHEVVEVSELPKFRKNAKNIILMVGDGMGASQVFAGITANKGQLNLMQFPVSGFSMTQSSSNYITDSAAGATAFSTGQRTYNGAIAVDTAKKPLKTILEIAEEMGMSTGLVSTSSITHATPASFIAHQPSRGMEEEIAADFLDTDIDVFIGGGKKFFTKRKDSVNLLLKLEQNGYTVLDNLTDIETSSAKKMAGFIGEGHGGKMPERGEALTISTKKAIDVLSANKEGFFLMVEGSQIDWGGHANNIEYIAREMLDFDKAIGAALEFALQDKNTLIIVTSDHETGGLAISGGDLETGKIRGTFTSNKHTAVMVPVFAIGPGANEFGGVYENTALFYKMLENWK